MINRITRTAGLVLAFGFFFGCKPASELAETRNLYESRNLTEAAESASRAINRNSNDAEAHLLYGRILLDLAIDKAPGNRTGDYEKASVSLNRAIELFSATDPAKSEQARQLLTSRWTDEIGRTDPVFLDSRTYDRDELTIALHHAGNAIALIPDSLSAWIVRSDIYYYLGDHASAVITLEQVPGKNADIFERIGYLYALSERPLEAADAFEQAWLMDTGNENVLFGLINALVEAGMTESAVTRLGDLSLISPDNALFPALEGSLRFDTIENRFVERMESGLAIGTGEISEGLAMLDLAETVFRRATDLGTNDPDIRAAAGTFYLNAASLLIDLAETSDEAVARTLENRAAGYLNLSVPHLLFVAEHEQDPAIWLSLHQIYVYLGMDDEAEDALINAGF